MINKIGVFTLPLTSRNYGGILQAYALTSYLRKEFKVDVELIDRRFPPSFLYNLSKFVYNIYIPGYIKNLDFFHQTIDEFKDKNIIKSPPVFSFNDTLNYLSTNNFDLILTGSDQVFRTLYSKKIYKDLFLGFNIPKIKKASYAGSFGTDSWEDHSLKSQVKDLLQDFDQISVREDVGLEILKEEFGLNGIQHIDPIFLLKSEDYRELIQRSHKSGVVNNVPYVGAYVLDQKPFKNQIIESTGQYLNLPHVRFGEKPPINRNNYKNYDGHQADSVIDWLNILYNSEFVIADSFHGVAFSILFNKPFIAIGNPSRGLSRFTSILKLFGLENRLILTDSTNFDVKKIIKEKINYTSINEIIEFERSRSLNYFNDLMC